MINYYNFKIEQRLKDTFVRFDENGKDITEKRLIKVAKFEDKSYSQIQIDNDGNEYFRIKNPYNDGFLASCYIDCPADAVRAVKEGYADCLIGNHKMFAYPGERVDLKPVILIDRDKAKEYRERTLEGWKDAEFGYAIAFGSKNSFSGYHVLDKNGKPCLFGEGIPNIFETKEEAEKYFEENFLDKAKELAKRYIDIKNQGSENDIFDRKYAFTCISDLMLGLINHTENKYSLNDINDPEFPYGWRIIQHLKDKKVRGK